ncbi:MAG: hypothetical protein B7C24_07590 [Bacteroidetes bacterium 4572_77]|nr:MAG: hypothetical protein B7C24_07590 [Bacteroidetes bacterium 4572_77]
MKKVLGLILVAVLFQSVVFAQETEKKAYKANNLTIFMSDIVMKRFSMEYEHVFGDKGNMAINVNGSASFDEMEDIYGDVQNWWGGIGVKFYPTGQGSIRFFTGPEVRIISAKDMNQLLILFLE